MPDKILWCCHVRGPDDIWAAPDYETALAWADFTNEMNWNRPSFAPSSLPLSWEDCLIKAVPALWPGSPEEHAAFLEESIKAFSRPICPHGICPTFSECRYACKDAGAAGA